MHFYYTLLTAICCFFGFLGLVHGEQEVSRNVLKPLHLPDFDPSSLSTRAQDFTALDPREYDTLLWGNSIAGLSRETPYS